MRNCLNCMINSMSIIDAPGGDLPWMVTCDLGKWQDFAVYIESIVKGKNDNGWSCYLTRMSHDDGPFEEDVEIPFWAMKPFFECIEEIGVKKGAIGMRYKRIQRDEKNLAKFEAE